ncbi:ATP-dependent Clp protease adapter ClpS [Aristophania vespae]|uniref:ATP-dependent Clp protease adapter protein ClpS n=1 Tax=Aristophania vespae TaxID=2697033 RepID=A0A6P1NC28_9PROT|nr:ATP-dependent Clp protease adapter ClpS [Aristophania vespae]QHI95063.1 ATP-dependent Clp protease adapter ClpS [Aristophania vespae]UMM64247.1 ATP-dependent Clp protease adapter protein ClpS [Aristophania vespae]
MPKATSSSTHGETLTQSKTRIAYPSMYKVIILNDDFTPIDFVIYVLERFFSKSSEEAQQITWNIHHNGSGVCGIFTREIAETKVNQVNDCARGHHHPLQGIMEKA